MSYIKTTNVIIDKEQTSYTREVQCPYCHTFLRPIPDYVTAMKCWHCNKEFRIEQDINKLISPNEVTLKHSVIKARIQ